MTATATPTPTPVVPEASSGFKLPEIHIHGFASEGGFLETANNYFGTSSQASLEFFEAGLNFSTQLTDRLRVGLQLYGRDIGQYQDSGRIDWAYLDYRWRDWLGLRAGIIKLPYGLYNEYEDIDSSRVAALMPQSVYPYRDRTVLFAQVGFELYGSKRLGGAGELEYQAWLGSLIIPSNAIDVEGATLNGDDSKYVLGAQIFWHPPVDGLKVGVSYLRTTLAFHLTFEPQELAQLAAAGLVSPTYNGKIDLYERPDSLYIGSAEYTRGDWLFAAEYARWISHADTSVPSLIPAINDDEERFYGLATYRATPWLATGAYYSVYNADTSNAMLAHKYYGYQRDLAATLRFDINDNWLWKVEGHFIDGTADLLGTINPTPKQFWGLFIVKTTVTF